MAVYRTRKTQKLYDTHLQKADANSCAFCTIQASDSQFVQETTNFKVIKNHFPYSVWDSQDVIDHLMIVPKQHVASLSKMTNNQKIEYVNLVEHYEERGYDLYARAPISAMKTVTHQHTHLIKLNGKLKRVIVAVKRPHLLLSV